MWVQKGKTNLSLEIVRVRPEEDGYGTATKQKLKKWTVDLREIMHPYESRRAQTGEVSPDLAVILEYEGAILRKVPLPLLTSN